MQNEQTNLLSEMDLQIDGHIKQQFADAAKWSKFISIVMFVVAGLVVLFGILGGSALMTTLKRLGGGYEMLDRFGGPILIIVFLFVAAIIAVTYYFLFNFSNKIKTALLAENTDELNKALVSLKTFFIITTVLSVLSLLIKIYNIFQ